MARLLVWLRNLFFIGVATLALDFVVTLFIPTEILDRLVAARERGARVYHSDVPWHHDLLPNVDYVRPWGVVNYRFRTDEYGFRTGPCAEGPLSRDNTILVIGDSFTEGLGVAFEDSFVGLLACAWARQGATVRNLGVISYSPAVYHRKLAGAVARTGVKPREIVVFLDLSDIANDGLDYVEKPDGSLTNVQLDRSRWLVEPLRRNFTSFAVLHQLKQLHDLRNAASQDVLENKLSRWTYTEKDQKEWALHGLEIAAANMGKIVRQCQEWKCRLTVVVYPWPDQVNRGEREGLQVTYWRDWSARNGARFVNGYAPAFFAIPPAQALDRYFVRGDVHYTIEGNRVLFEEVWKQMSASGR